MALFYFSEAFGTVREVMRNVLKVQMQRNVTDGMMVMSLNM